MNLKKVVYHNGNNSLYDYFISRQKSEIKIGKESLAYQFDKTVDSAFVINQSGIEGNFDLILEVRLKNGEVKGVVPCNFEDINLI